MSLTRTFLAVLTVVTFSLNIDARAEPAKIRMGWAVAGGDAPLQQLGDKGTARHEGKSYTLELMHFNGTTPMISALASGDLDVTSMSGPPLALAVENAHLTDLRIIADIFQDGVGQGFSNTYFVLKDGPIQSIEDLKGKIAAVNVIGGAVDIGLRAMVQKHGLEAKRDFTLIETAFPNMKAVLLDRKADLIGEVTPFAFDPELLAKARPLFHLKDVLGPTQLIVMVARTGFIEKNRAALTDFLEDNLRTIAWYRDPAHHDEAVKTLSDFTKTPPAVWANWAFTSVDAYRDPNGKPNLDSFARGIEAAHAQGFVPAAIDPHQYADLSMIEEAARRLH
ncbi:MAG TPA: ABC transporter substrate-binding protein [Stellaceae bacterium]|jgi:NitT/TauT family transport system substrate-binding protein|nr:ABC transporter substrate-binding protein [Stellaceae bacterium]